MADGEEGATKYANGAKTIQDSVQGRKLQAMELLRQIG
jgi:hypothetical protein